jgi:hypothetical protein
MVKAFQCLTEPQVLRNAGKSEDKLRPPGSNALAQSITSSDGHLAADDDRGSLLERWDHPVNGFVDGTEVHLIVFIDRRIKCDQNVCCVGDAALQISRIAKRSAGEAAAEERIDAGFGDRRLTAIETGDRFLVEVDADNRQAQTSQAN